MPENVEAEADARGSTAWRDRSATTRRSQAALKPSSATVAGESGGNVMPRLHRGCARAGVTTGEWGGVRSGEIFGEYRAPTGVSPSPRAPMPSDLADRPGPRSTRPVGQARPPREASSSASPASTAIPTASEQIAVQGPGIAAWTVVYEGIRLTPERDRQRGARGAACTRSACRSCRAPTWRSSANVLERMRRDGLDATFR